MFSPFLYAAAMRASCSGIGTALLSLALSTIPNITIGVFLQHFDKDVDRRGHDPSVTIPTQSQLRTVPKLDQTDLEKHNERHRVFRLMLIPDRDDASQRSEFLISYPPKYTSRSPFGRATRPMVAYDLQESHLVFVKDYWRPVGSDTTHRHAWQRERH